MPQKRTNILHIFTDQLRFDAIHSNGNPVIKTPNLDRLAAMGVSYQRAYTPSPVCVAARCSMITGCYPTKTNCLSNDKMPDDRPSFMEVLTQNGYRTHGIGFLAEFFDLKSHLRKTAAVFEEQLFFLHAQVQNNRRRQHLGLEGPVPQIFHKTLI